ncbi:ATP-binding cassette sub-family C member 4-like isoform X3 [Ruditapes philippinarum]|uniref:ATP-binding cassette sub-family C member 4-like isoform X3 n=1 Tax=Ruditapes philippinarum TaxID=129788 RepID=UPI00295A8586|nr:ATP-binding cassette sub-family C member 4-like isoform X3 [Ruditapes philippinarum]
MDESLKHHNPNPVIHANPISKIFFWWMNPLFKKGYGRQLEIDDMYNVTVEDQSDKLGERLEKEWKKEVDKCKDGKRKPSLFQALFKIFGLEYILLGFVLFLEEATKVIQPLLLGGLIRYFTPGSGVSKTESYLYAMGVSLCAIMLAISHHPYFFGVQRIGMKMRIACCSLLYRKSLRLSSEGLGKTTTGQIVNLMSNDVNRFDQAVIFLHFLWVGPIEAVAVLAILWRELGPSTLAGFAVLLLLVPVQGWMGKLFSKFRQKTAKYTDERVKLMNEIIAGMRVIKMYCWEKPFGDLVRSVRRLEVKHVERKMITEAVLDSYIYSGRYFCVYATVVCLTVIGKALRAEKVFVTLVLFVALENVFFWFLQQGVKMISELIMCVKRLQTFLQLDELPENEQKITEEKIPVKECFIDINNVSARWDQKVEQFTLQNVTARVEPGKLLAVIGPVGAGKSSLLMSVLKELPLLKGNIELKGRIAYVSQQPWVFSASLRQNIIFGNKYEKLKYDRILKACALTKDIDVMPHGDMTLIGDRGVSLSGGQRARVSLARALYMDAEVYLLDDPLSAVDASVGRHLFENVVQGILKNKPRILVTHQLQFLKEAEQILILKEGDMIGKGTFQELSTSGIDFSSLLKHEEEEEEPPPDLYESFDPHQSQSRLHGLHSKSHEHVNGYLHNLRKRTRVDSSCSHHSVNDSVKGSMMSLASIGTEFEAETVQLPEEEERHEGTVGMSVYYQYFKAGAGIIKFLILALLCIAAQVAYIYSDWWLSIWSNQEEARFAAMREDSLLRNEYQLRNLTYNGTNITIPEVDTHFNVAVFSGLIASVFLLGLLRALMFFKVAVDASQALHNTMFAAILRSHIGFFDTNPVGRILNRFSKDVGHMDDILPITFFDFIQCGLLILGIVIVAGVVNPWVFIIVVPLIVMFIIVRRYYIRTSRHIKRLEGTTRSPVFSHLSATLQGLHTIRAFGAEGKFTEEFDCHQDLHTESWFLFLSSSRWLAIRLDWLCAIFVTAVSFCCVFAAESLNAGLVGLSMTYAMTLMGMFQWGVRQSAEVENQMISVERVLDYAKLPSEAQLEVEEEKQPPPSWPQNGQISTDEACLRYSKNGPLVLKDLSFTIRAREKVGIVGRTGAGKSSLITMLFRLVEPNGRITIDNINVQSIGLHDLRKHISIIPQDPVLFTGKLRRNLDPFSNHGDDALWNALTEVQLKQAIEDLPHGLDSEVSEGGINFSVGQRQLICLARAILRNNKILMIDEATANVDPRTDALIQQTIREKFSKCTVLTIAHRLHTIMDSDRLLVLDDGKVVEFDVPYKLLQSSNSTLRKLVEQTGKSETIHLMEIAKTAFEKSKEIVDSNVKDGKVNEQDSVSVNNVSAIVEDNDRDNNDDADMEMNEERSLLVQDSGNVVKGDEGKVDKVVNDGMENTEGKDKLVEKENKEFNASGKEGKIDVDHEVDKEERASGSDETEDGANEYTLTDIEDASHDDIEDVDDDNAKLLGKDEKDKEDMVDDTKQRSETKHEVNENDETSKLLPGHDEKVDN